MGRKRLWGTAIGPLVAVLFCCMNETAFGGEIHVSGCVVTDTGVPVPHATVGSTNCQVEPANLYYNGRAYQLVDDLGCFSVALPQDDCTLVALRKDGVLDVFSDEQIANRQIRELTLVLPNSRMGGIGIALALEEPWIVAESWAGPARHAGIGAGCRILEVDGIRVHGMDVDSIVTLIRGEIATSVRIEYLCIGDRSPTAAVLVRERLPAREPVYEWVK